MKQGIIVVNKGTQDLEVRMKTLDDFVLSIGDRIEDAEISLVFTDGEIEKQFVRRQVKRFRILKLKYLL